MNLTRATYETRSQKVRDFLIGYIGWFVLNALVNALLYAFAFLSPALMTSNDYDPTLQSTLSIVGLVCNIGAFLLNIGLLIYFALTRYWIALGALSAFGTLFALAICAAVVIGVVCFVSLAGAGNFTPP